MSKPLVQQVCERARGLVDDPRTWTQFAIARAGNHRACELTDKRAVRFCAYGAILRSAYDVAGDDYAMALQLADRAAMAITGQDSPLAAFEDLIEINDGPRASARQNVLALLDTAAAKV
jgi:hypothetical protein